MRRSFMIVLAVSALAACGDSKPKPAPLTQRQHDSALGASGLPGSNGIRGAIRLQDSQAARNARLDSLSRP